MAKRRTVSVKSLTVDQNVRCQRIIPVEGDDCPAKHSRRWRGHTIAFHLTREQAVHLARVLLAGTQEWDGMWVTAWRNQKRADDTYPVTVTGEAGPEDD